MYDETEITYISSDENPEKSNSSIKIENSTEYSLNMKFPAVNYEESSFENSKSLCHVKIESNFGPYDISYKSSFKKESPDEYSYSHIYDDEYDTSTGHIYSSLDESTEVSKHDFETSQEVNDNYYNVSEPSNNEFFVDDIKIEPEDNNWADSSSRYNMV